MLSINNKIKIIFIDGNIGVGKSTFISKLDKNIYNVIDEPMKSFCNFEMIDENNNRKILNPLDAFYKKEVSNLFFQSYVIIEIINELKKNLKIDKINIIVRSPLSSLYIFSKNLFNNNELKIEEYNLLKKITDSYFIDYIKESKNLTQIYLKASVETCYERIKNRNRIEENTISKDYLTAIHDNYEIYINDLINKKQSVEKNILDLNFKIFIIDAETNSDDILNSFNNLSIF